MPCSEVVLHSGDFCPWAEEVLKKVFIVACFNVFIGESSPGKARKFLASVELCKQISFPFTL